MSMSKLSQCHVDIIYRDTEESERENENGSEKVTGVFQHRKLMMQLYLT